MWGAPYPGPAECLVPHHCNHSRLPHCPSPVAGTCHGSCKFSSPCSKADSGACGPDSCPYCAQPGTGELEPGDQEMPDSDSEAVYEFTQDAQHSDLRDPHSRRQRTLGVDAEPSPVLAFWRLICDTFRKIVDSKYFGRGIMIAILVNTLSMGIEYHEQVGLRVRPALASCSPLGRLPAACLLMLLRSFPNR